MATSSFRKSSTGQGRNSLRIRFFRGRSPLVRSFIGEPRHASAGRRFFRLSRTTAVQITGGNMLLGSKRGTTRLLPFAVLAIVVALSALPAFGQGIVTGTMSGTVQDAQQAVIVGANVRVVNVGTNIESNTQTDAQGFFMVKNLAPGTYDVTITAPSFSKLEVKNLAVVVGRNTNLGTQVMRVGGATEIVTVEASAPLVDAQTSQVGSTFTTRTVGSVPLGGTGFDFLALFVPGVANNGSANFSNTNGASIANNGLRGRSNNFQIDGQSNNDNSVAGPSLFLNNPDVIGEVQIINNNFSVEYGRNSGTVVNYITKSGTNSFHGSAFNYYTGSWSYSHANQEKNPVQGFCVNGRVDPVANGCTRPTVPRFVENRWGGTIGGPIVKDKAWFFASYQQDPQRGSATGTSSSLTPTPAGIGILDSAFPGNAAVAWLKAQGPYAITAGNPAQAGAVQTIPVSGTTTTVNVPFAFITRSI